MYHQNLKWHCGGCLKDFIEEVDYCGNCVALCHLRRHKESAAGRTTSGSLFHLSQQTNRAMTKVIALFVVGLNKLISNCYRNSILVLFRVYCRQGGNIRSNCKKFLPYLHTKLLYLLM